MVADPDLIERLANSPPNNLGSSILSQRAALAGLKIKAEWFRGVLEGQRANQKLIFDALKTVAGLEMPVYPSNGNFIIIECAKAGVSPESLVTAYQDHGIMIRQGAYHTPNFGDRFIKVSTSVPSSWVEEFVALLPAMVERARGRNEPVKLF